WDGDPRPEGQGRFGGLVAIEGVEAAHRRDPDVDGTQGLEMCGAQPFAQISRVAERDTVDLEDLHVHGAPEAGALELVVKRPHRADTHPIGLAVVANDIELARQTS